MKVLLLKDVSGMGKKFDIKNVSDGHAMNYLIPRGFAKIASDEALKWTEDQKSRIDADKEVQKSLAMKNIEMLNGMTIMIKGKASDKGHLFAQIHKEAIIDAVWEQAHIKLDVENIKLDKHIKELGEHKVPIDLAGVIGEIKIKVESE